MKPSTRPRRPAFLDPRHIQLPVGAWTSIGHRISGIVLAASVPLVVFLLWFSLKDEQAYGALAAMVRHAAFKLAALVVVWALAHHLLAGVRHLLSDFDVGSRLRTSRRSAWFVNLGGIVLTLLAAAALL